MKIKYLIEELQKFDPEGEAFVRNPNGLVVKAENVVQLGCGSANQQIVIESGKDQNFSR